MKKRTKHWLFGILTAILVGFALLNVLAYNHAHAMMHFTCRGSRTGKPEKLAFGQRIPKTLTCPALFMHGADDPRAKIEEGRRVFAAAPGIKKFKEFPSIGHESYLSRYPAEWTATVGTFLR